MPVDDELLSNIHTLIEQVGQGTSETLLELLARIVTAETVAVQLQARVDDHEARRDRDAAEWAAAHEQLRRTLVEMRHIFWGLTTVVGIIVLLLVIATLARVLRG